jgi:LemA protein
MEMLKKFLPWIIVAVIVIGIYGWASGIYNNAVRYEQDIKESWGNVQTSYQRRNDLIGNLVNTVKGAADFEKSTLTAVIEARAKATSITFSGVPAHAVITSSSGWYSRIPE